MWKCFDITALTQKWVDDPTTNMGVLLRAENEDDAGGDMRIYSRNSTEKTNRPPTGIALPTAAKTGSRLPI